MNQNGNLGLNPSQNVELENNINNQYNSSLVNNGLNNTQNISLNKINKNCFNLSINKDLPSPVYKCKSNINKVKYLYLMLKLSTPSKIKLNLLNGINDEEFKIKDSISSFISKYNKLYVD